MNLNTEDIRKNGESVVLDRQENFSIEQNENQLIKHKQIIVVERFHYSKEDKDNMAKKAKSNAESTNEDCLKNMEENLSKLDDAEIQLNKLANEVSSELQKVRDLRNCLMSVKIERDQRDEFERSDKTWNEHLGREDYSIYRNMRENEVRPIIDSYSSSPNSRNEKMDAKLLQNKYSRNYQNSDQNSSSQNNKSPKNQRTQKYPNNNPLVEQENLQENSSNKKKKPRGFDMKYDTGNEEINNTTYEKGIDQKNSNKHQNSPLVMDKELPSNSKNCQCNNVCTPVVCTNVEPVMDCNCCYSNDFGCDYQLQAVPTFGNNCWDCGCCCCCCYPTNVLEEILLNTSPGSTATIIEQNNTNPNTLNQLPIKQINNEESGQQKNPQQEPIANISDDEDLTNDEDSEESIAQQIFYKSSNQADSEKVGKSRYPAYDNAMFCKCCCCHIPNNYEYDSIKEDRINENINKSIKNEKYAVPQKGKKKGAENIDIKYNATEKKSKPSKPSNKTRLKSVDEYTSKHAKNGNKSTKNNRNIPLKQWESNSSPKKVLAPKGNYEKRQYRTRSEKNSNKKIVGRNIKSSIEIISPDIKDNNNLYNERSTPEINDNNKRLKTCCKICCCKETQNLNLNNNLESENLKLNQNNDNDIDDVDISDNDNDNSSDSRTEDIRRYYFSNDDISQNDNNNVDNSDSYISDDISSNSDKDVSLESEKSFNQELRNETYCCCCCACNKNMVNEEWPVNKKSAKTGTHKNSKQQKYYYENLEREIGGKNENQIKDFQQKVFAEYPATNRIQRDKFCHCCCCDFNTKNVAENSNTNAEKSKFLKPLHSNQKVIVPVERKSYNKIRNRKFQIDGKLIPENSLINQKKIKKNAKDIKSASKKKYLSTKETIPNETQSIKYKKTENRNKPKIYNNGYNFQKTESNESYSYNESHLNKKYAYPIQHYCKCYYCSPNKDQKESMSPSQNVVFQNPNIRHIDVNTEDSYKVPKHYYSRYGSQNKNSYDQERNTNLATIDKCKKESEKGAANDQMYTVNKYKLKNEKALMDQAQKVKNTHVENSFDSEFLQTLNTLKNINYKPYRHPKK